jgi:hypothetical protein
LNNKPNGPTIAIVRKGKEIAPNQDEKLSTDEIIEGIYRTLNAAFGKIGSPITRDE